MLSPSNARLAGARRLTRRTARREAGRFLAEGAQAVRAALAAASFALRSCTTRSFSCEILLKATTCSARASLTAFCFVCIGAAILLALGKQSWKQRLTAAGLLACAVGVTSVVGVFGYGFDIEATYGGDGNSRMAISTANSTFRRNCG